LVWLLFLALDYGFDDGLFNGEDLGQLCSYGSCSIVSFDLTGWSEPRLTKTCSTPASHSASKKAKDAV